MLKKISIYVIENMYRVRTTWETDLFPIITWKSAFKGFFFFFVHWLATIDLSGHIQDLAPWCMLLPMHSPWALRKNNSEVEGQRELRPQWILNHQDKATYLKYKLQCDWKWKIPIDGHEIGANDHIWCFLNKLQSWQ